RTTPSPYSVGNERAWAEALQDSFGSWSHLEKRLRLKKVIGRPRAYLANTVEWRARAARAREPGSSGGRGLGRSPVGRGAPPPITRAQTARRDSASADFWRTIAPDSGKLKRSTSRPQRRERGV